MRWTLRRRIQLVGLICLLTPAVVTWLFGPPTGWGAQGLVLCSSAALRGSAACRQAYQHPHAAELLVTGVLLVAAVTLAVVGLRRAAAWCTQPLRELAGPISRVGPLNLGHRVHARGDVDLAVIGDAIDAMMERVAAGYEGQRRFAANASHELRTPLSVQRTLIEVGMSADATPDQLDLLTRQLLATNERNERLIEGLLVLAESDQGLVSRTPQRLDLIAAAVVAAYGDRARAAGVEITTELAERTVPGERVLLERLVTNLVQNAITYNRPGGTVHVSVGEQPALSVVNTGPAVPAELAEEIFEPFRRLGGRRIDHSGGAGLGLTIARSITIAHEGHISATPQGQDGLRIDVRLPVAAPAPDVPDAPVAPVAPVAQEERAAP